MLAGKGAAPAPKICRQDMGAAYETMKTKKRGRDSNSESRDMNPVCCRCITPQRTGIAHTFPYIGYCAFFRRKLKVPEKIII